MKASLSGSYAEYAIGIILILVLIRRSSQISDMYIVDVLGLGLILGFIGYMLFSRFKW